MSGVSKSPLDGMHSCATSVSLALLVLLTVTSTHQRPPPHPLDPQELKDSFPFGPVRPRDSEGHVLPFMAIPRGPPQPRPPSAPQPQNPQHFSKADFPTDGGPRLSTPPTPTPSLPFPTPAASNLPPGSAVPFPPVARPEKSYGRPIASPLATISTPPAEHTPGSPSRVVHPGAQRQGPEVVATEEEDGKLKLNKVQVAPFVIIDAPLLPLRCPDGQRLGHGNTCRDEE